MTDEMPWFIAIFVIGWVLALLGNILGWVYRKPGVTMSVLINGYPDEPAPSGLLVVKRMLSYVQDDKRKLVYGVLFLAAFLIMADVLAMLFLGLVMGGAR